MRILFAVTGSHGDVLPVLAIAAHLQQRGHAVRQYANAYFQELAAQADVPFTTVGAAALHDDFLHQPGNQNVVQATELVARYFLSHVLDCYDAMRGALLVDQTIVVGSPLSFAVRLLQETCRVPAATVYYACSLMRSVHEPPRIDHWYLSGFLPPSIRRRASRTISIRRLSGCSSMEASSTSCHWMYLKALSTCWRAMIRARPMQRWISFIHGCEAIPTN